MYFLGGKRKARACHPKIALEKDDIVREYREQKAGK